MVTAGILPFWENSHGRTGNRTRDLMISRQRLWSLDHKAVLIIIYLSWSLATCCPFPVSRTQKSLQRSTTIPSASRTSVSLPWVIYFEAFYLHAVSSFSCIPVIYPKLVLFLTPLQFVRFVICPSVSCCIRGSDA